MNDRVRPSAVAGTFYPGGADTLAAQVERLIAGAAPVEMARAPKMLVVPHAGYVYSGPIAAQAYALLARWRAQVRRVVLLGPAHRLALRGLALPGVSAFETPLGRVQLDGSALSQLRGLAQVSVDDAAHAKEHSLEVQLPFLQRVLDQFTLVPMVVGAASAQQVAEVLERLWGGDETLVVISTDLSHYLPYAEASWQRARMVSCRACSICATRAIPPEIVPGWWAIAPSPSSRAATRRAIGMTSAPKTTPGSAMRC